MLPSWASKLARPAQQQIGIDVGLFSFLKRKNAEAGARTGAATPVRTGEPTRMTLDTEAERERQRAIARATAAKIDAIELAMASDIFNEPEPAWGSDARRPSAAAASPGVPAASMALAEAEQTPDPAVLPASAPVAEESAILYANGAADEAEQLLLASLGGPGRNQRLPWWMLFDLYQASAREHDFESIAIDYASHFETSPPAFTPLASPGSAERRFAGLALAEMFTGVLDGAIDTQLQRLLAAAGAGTPVRLEFAGVQRATPDGCARLLAALRALRGARGELVVAGAEQLIAVLRPMLAIGERGNDQAPWLLLLELLQLLNREKDFEETAMDYCVTYEVSPPSFEPAAAMVAAARAGLGSAGPGHPGDARRPDAGRGGARRRFMLPALVEGDSRALLAAIEAYAAEDDIVVLDCSRLACIDYAAATALHGCLAALAAAGRRIELRDLNHLVAVLLRLLGYAGYARLYAHKY
jgi:anti-anti-sigma regulatory factor